MEPSSATQSISRASDVIRARQLGCELATGLGFCESDRTSISTSISEIARNVLQHSGSTGTVTIEVVAHGGRHGLQITVMDRGCGIAALASALPGRGSTSVTDLGAGLPGAKRLMDELEVETTLGQGTVVRMTKWLPRGDAAQTNDDALVATTG